MTPTLPDFSFLRLETHEDIDVCRSIRRAVFIQEQHVAESDEWDGQDEIHVHYLAFYNQEPVGTARFRIDPDGEGKIGRFCLLKQARGKGFGQKFLSALVQDMKHDKTLTLIKISAQTHAVSFYEKAGFVVTGGEYLDCNIPHFDMVLKIK